MNAIERPLTRSIPHTAWKRLSLSEQEVILGLEAVIDTPCLGERDDERGVYKADVDYIAQVIRKDRRTVLDALARAHKRRVVDLALVAVIGSVFVIASRRGAKVAAFEEAADMMDRPFYGARVA